MREIKFRGRRIDNREWVEGYYTYTCTHWSKGTQSQRVYEHVIHLKDGSRYIVDPTSVFQTHSNPKLLEAKP